MDLEGDTGVIGSREGTVRNRRGRERVGPRVSGRSGGGVQSRASGLEPAEQRRPLGYKYGSVSLLIRQLGGTG